MVNNCANPSCGKPLHYLREGRIFVFDMPDPNGAKSNRREHFWLCGPCSQSLLLEQASGSIRVIPKRSIRPRRAVPLQNGALAS